MGDHQHGAVEAGHEPLELVAAAHVEVRLGLVEQQHVGAAREARGERDELALAAAELAGRALERRVGEAEVAQVACGPRPPRGRRRARPSGRAAAPGGRARASSRPGRRRAPGRRGGARPRAARPRARRPRAARRAPWPAACARRPRPAAGGRRARARGGGRPRRRRGARGPARIRSSVDLPPPLGPSTPMRAPAASSRSSPSSTRRPPKVFASPRAERRGTLAMSRPASGGAGSRQGG